MNEREVPFTECSVMLWIVISDSFHFQYNEKQQAIITLTTWVARWRKLANLMLSMLAFSVKLEKSSCESSSSSERTDSKNV